MYLVFIQFYYMLRLSKSAISHQQVAYRMMAECCCGKLKHVAVPNINHIHQIYTVVFIGKLIDDR